MTETPTPKPSSSPVQSGGFDANRPTIISILYLGGFITGGLGTLIGIVLAHVWKGEAHDPWMASHFDYLIRTFWIGFVVSIIGLVLSIVLIGIPLLIATAVWVGVRSVMSLIKAQRQEPMPDPETLLI